MIITNCSIRKSEKIEEEDVDKALLVIKPLSLSPQLQSKWNKNHMLWDQIGGMKEAKTSLVKTLTCSKKHSGILSKFKVKLSKGILLYGPSGCGKTIIACAAAKQFGFNIITVKGPELLSKYIGGSEQQVRDLFERASSIKPCILFFDEFESIAPKRGGQSSVTDRVVNQFLTYLDGADEITNGMHIIAASTHPERIDPALLRPGRLDKHILCDFPNELERRDVRLIVFIVDFGAIN